ncbi:MAG: nucleoside hydrolase [Actinomycetota bacterium]|nr:nucleoside hydrolase [Actinomycetota bacterium]
MSHAASSSESRRAIVLDTDTAADDCFALLACLLHPAADLKAVTVVAGNVGFDQQLENALITIEQCGRSGEVPVHPGCTESLVRGWTSAENVHGDGKGHHEWPAPAQRPESEHAALALVRLAEEHRGELDLVCIGPLTNVATALAIDRRLPEKIRSLYVMGGSNNGRGNITPSAEYNFYVDPEAARAALRAGFSVTVVDWVLTLRQAVFGAEQLEEIAALDTPLSRFFGIVNTPTLEFDRSVGIEGSTHPDLLTALALLEPSIVVRTSRYFLDVDTADGPSRGYSTFDWGVFGREPNADVVEEIDEGAFFERVKGLLCTGPGEA